MKSLLNRVMQSGNYYIVDPTPTHHHKNKKKRHEKSNDALDNQIIPIFTIVYMCMLSLSI